MRTIDQDVNSSTITLWDFPFLQYRSFHSMRVALIEMYKTNPSAQFWSQYNQEGYTFTQWQIYFLSKKYYRYKSLRGPVFTLFNVLASMPFFIDLLLTGTRDDPCHHTIHHYLYHMECGINNLQTKMYDFLVKELSKHQKSHFLYQKDKNGSSVVDYFQRLCLPTEVVEKCRNLTEAYKRTEQQLFGQLQFLSKCKLCSSYLQPYDELIQHHQTLYDFLDTQPEWSDKLLGMLVDRDQCNRLYAEMTQHEMDEKCIARHDYVLEVYRKLFDW